MQVEVIEERGHWAAFLGLGLSFGLTSGMAVADLEKPENEKVLQRLYDRAMKLADKDGGHNKFMESITVWIDVTAPRYWWSEMDTYRVGMTKQSESTMHTLKRDGLREKNFEGHLPSGLLNYLNDMIAEDYPIEAIKNVLPDGFLQRRILCTNYKTLRHILLQRKNHKLPEWRFFCEAVKEGVHYSAFLPEVK